MSRFSSTAEQSLCKRKVEGATPSIGTIPAITIFFILGIISRFHPLLLCTLLLFYFYDDERIIAKWIYFIMPVFGFIWSLLLIQIGVIYAKGSAQVLDNQEILVTKSSAQSLLLKYDAKKHPAEKINNKKIYFSYFKGAKNNRLIKIHRIQELYDQSYTHRIRESIISFLKNAKNFPLFQSLIIGSRLKDSAALDLLKLTGCYHLFVISGFHFSIIAKALDYICNCLLALSFTANYAVNRHKVRRIFVGIFLFLYWMLLIPSPASLRAMLMSIFSLRKEHLFLVAFVMLLFNPALALSWSFKFSFLSTYAIYHSASYLKEIHIALLLTPFLSMVSPLIIVYNFFASRFMRYFLPICIAVICLKSSLALRYLDTALSYFMFLLNKFALPQIQLNMSGFLPIFYEIIILFVLLFNRWDYLYIMFLISFVLSFLS